MTSVADPDDIDALIAALTLEEKAGLCSGAGFWQTRAVERLGIDSIAVADGPHGLRIQIDGGDHLGIDSSEPATCFPPAVTLASTWNVETVRAVGEAIGTEARAAGLAVVLGPGVNIKRSPLCGRNFEYFSEDPHVAAAMGTAWVQGLQSTGVGASLKHFAVNNQETDRLRVSAEVDERTLREIYLAAFEPVVRQAAPWTVMCAYNRINGTYASEDHWLLTEVLREEGGFDGLVVSDWGAVDDPVASVQAGLDLEMPSTGKASPEALTAAVRAGRLDEADLDTVVRRVLTLVKRAPRQAATAGVDVDAHHLLARRAAAEGAVLLKNDRSALPLALADGQRLAVIGEFARSPRFQGAGSSQVNPTRVDDALGALRDALGEAVTVDFAAGYRLDPDADPGGTAPGAAGSEGADLVAEAVAVAEGADAVVVFVGLPPSAESEGFDRDHLDLPADQLRCVEALAAVHPNLVAVLVNGGVVTVDDVEASAAAVLECWLGGQASGSAVADLLLGEVNPSGRLAESIPHRIEDTSAFGNFPGSERQVHYGEGLLVGYRRATTAGVEMAHPFGFGLSYTTFGYSDLAVEVHDPPSMDATVMQVSATITNTGAVAGAEVVQVYVGSPGAPVPRPARELRAFTKVFLEPGASQRVDFALTRRDLARWSVRSHDWVFDPGTYEVAVAASSEDLREVRTVELGGEVPVGRLDAYSTLAEWLAHPTGRARLVDTMRTSPVGDLTPLLEDASLLRMIGPFPLRRLLPMLGGAFRLEELDDLIAQANTA